MSLAGRQGGKIRVASAVFVDRFGRELDVRHAFGDETSTGQKLAVAAVAGKRLIVLGWQIASDVAADVNFSSDPAGTPSAISPVFPAVRSWWSDHREAWFETVAGEALGINIANAASLTQLGWAIAYCEA